MVTARDVMTSRTIALGPGNSVKHAAQLMLDQRISGIPVVDDLGELCGIVTEGDLLRRTELGTECPADQQKEPGDTARAYVKSHSWSVGDVMTKNVISVEENATVGEIATLMELRGIKRVPVVRDGRLIGVVSRADLLQAIAASIPSETGRGDEAIRLSVRTRLADAAGVLSSQPSVTVENGVVHVWGEIRSQPERDMVRVIVESVNGVAFMDHLAMVPSEPRDDAARANAMSMGFPR